MYLNSYEVDNLLATYCFSKNNIVDLIDPFGKPYRPMASWVYKVFRKGL